MTWDEIETAKRRAASDAVEREIAEAAPPRAPDELPHMDSTVLRHPNGHLMVERHEHYTPSREATAKWLASVEKAYPYLVTHASHIDGEFDNAITDLRRGVEALHDQLDRMRESIVLLTSSASLAPSRDSGALLDDLAIAVRREVLRPCEITTRQARDAREAVESHIASLERDAARMRERLERARRICEMAAAYIFEHDNPEGQFVEVAERVESALNDLREAVNAPAAALTPSGEPTATPEPIVAKGPCFVLPDGNCVSPFDCVHGPGVNMEDLIADKVYLDWLEEHLNYAVIRTVTSPSTPLETEGLGYRNGALRRSVNREIQRQNEYMAKLDRKAPT